MSILEVKNLSIRYITGNFKNIGLKEYVMLRLQHTYQATEFWADKDISFSLEQGDMLGIIGTNGAGKSTLLKAVSGIMEPTKGKVTRKGTIAALLELSSGFDGDLTVRENTYLRGAMLGYTRQFMDETYKDIIKFAELEEFQDRPFKQLSTGMKSRLAFSIASLVRPDILILDEVLSVGDGAFRAKSETKMREIIAGGTTTILVSHSLTQVKALCNKVLWLEKGRQIAFGDTASICELYQQYLDKQITLEELGYEDIRTESPILKGKQHKSIDSQGELPKMNCANVESEKNCLGKTKSNIPWKWLLVIFVLSTFCRGIYAASEGQYGITDEVLHIGLAKSIAAGQGLYVRGVLHDYREFLYSLVISPAFMVTRDAQLSHSLVMWINAALMSSAVYPIYLLAQKFLSNRWHVWMVVAYGMLISEMSYTLSAMQENLNYPLMMWFFFAFCYVVLEERNSVRNMIMLGAFAFLLTISKQMNLSIIVAIIGLYILKFLMNTTRRGQVAKDIFLFITAFIILKIAYNVIMDTCLKNASVTSSISGSIINAITNMGILKHLIFPAILYLAFTLLATGIFPIPTLAGSWKTFPKKSQEMITLIFLYILISIATICILIVPAEDFGTLAIRVHLRYFFYAFIIIITLFLQWYECSKKDFVDMHMTLFILIYLAAILMFLPTSPMTVRRNFSDGVSINYLRLLAGNEVLEAAQRCILVFVILSGAYLLYKKHFRKLNQVVAGILIISMLVGPYYYSHLMVNVRWVERDGSSSVNDALVLNEYFFSLANADQNDAESVLLASIDHPTDEIFECFFNQAYRCIRYKNYEKLAAGQEVNFGKLPLWGYRGVSWIDPEAEPPQYIVSKGIIDLQGYLEEDLGLNAYHLYKWTGETVVKV